MTVKELKKMLSKLDENLNISLWSPEEEGLPYDIDVLDEEITLEGRVYLNIVPSVELTHFEISEGLMRRKQ